MSHWYAREPALKSLVPHITIRLGLQDDGDIVQVSLKFGTEGPQCLERGGLSGSVI